MLRGLKQFNLPGIEEKVLKFWKENDIFKKSLALWQNKGVLRSAQDRKTKVFRFFEGPPTANGRPGLHHVLARAFKDIICRFKTMQGFFVLRRAGWDTHGLPVELEVEKKLGLKDKQEIEKFGIAEFNSQAKMSVWAYKSEWEKFTERIGFWLDLENPYITYDNKYIESLWWVFGEIAKRGLLKKLYKVVPWCPRCQTPLSSHELGQPGAYKLTKDPSIYVKFKIKNEKGKNKEEYLLVWTTTPWTLPANVAVAVNPHLTYTKYKVGDEFFWSYSVPPKVEGKEMEVIEKISGKKLVGLEYEPLYQPLGVGNVGVVRNEQSQRAKQSNIHHPSSNFYQVISADFVSTEDGTGMVHIAPAFGEDDLRVAGQGVVPVTIDDRGMVKKGLPGGGKFIKEADSDIIKDLDKRGLLYSAGTIEHEYPFCWRCSTPLIYFARHSWFIEISKLKNDLIAANKKINWIPEHIKEGRFGEWLKDLKDWAISRERYWGTPLPIWECEKEKDHRLFIGSLEDLNKYAYNTNKFFIARHCESDHNVEDVFAAGPEKDGNGSKLTERGLIQAEKMGKVLKKAGIDIIYSSPFIRTQQTAKIISQITGAKIITDQRLSELNPGNFSGRPSAEYRRFFKNDLERFIKTPPGGENLNDAKRRMTDFLLDVNSKNDGKNILIVGHGDPLWILDGAIRGLSNEEINELEDLKTGEYAKLPYNNWPFNKDGELDIHRPFVDGIYLKCPARLPDGQECGGKMSRIKEVADVWFDSGAMPFAQWHYPFENKQLIDKKLQFPADYITEAVDQTRGWFYTLLAVSVLLGYKNPYQNVISLGHVLDKNGQKMSKSKGNAVDPMEAMQKYGADVLRWYFYTVNPPGEPKRFDENDLRKTFNKLFMLLYNSFVFYDTYGKKGGSPNKTLDNWIIARVNQVIEWSTNELEKYNIGGAAKFIEDLVDDLSRWYIRRSRKNVSGKTLNIVLSTLSKLIAPFVPFFSEALWKSLDVGNVRDVRNGRFQQVKRSNIEHLTSVHLADWPKADKKMINKKLLEGMTEVRRLASLALAEREKAGIKVRQPLASLKLKTKNEKLKTNEELLEILKDEVNVKEIKFDGKIQADLELDIKITPELRNEGIMRELVRMIQGLRHDAKYQPRDEIALMIELPKELLEMIGDRGSELKKAVNAKQVIFKKEKFDAELDTKLEDWSIWLAVRKI